MSRLGVFNRIRRYPALYSAGIFLHDLVSLVKGMRRGSYSQHGEDVFAAHFFAGRTNGFYLDIGASHPFKLSNTFLLYRSGWRGVTVEPIPRLGKLHRRWRSRDSLFPIAVGVSRGAIDFFEMTPSVLSTLDRSVADQYVASNQAVLFRTYKIDMLTINDIIERASAIAHVDFLSIDIEGLDADVLSSIDFKKFRPALICVEFNSKAIRRTMEALFDRVGYKIIKEIACNLMVTPI